MNSTRLFVIRRNQTNALSAAGRENKGAFFFLFFFFFLRFFIKEALTSFRISHSQHSHSTAEQSQPSVLDKHQNAF